MRAFLSLVIAVVASIVGDLLLWGGGSSLARLHAQFVARPADALLPSVFLVLGLVCLAGAMLTAGWSSLGVIVVGIVQTLSGLAVLLLPSAIYAGALGSVQRISTPVGNGIFPWWVSGLGIVTGIVFLVGGIAIATRRPRSTAAGRVTTTVMSVVLGVGVILLLAFGGARLIQSSQRGLSAIELLGVLLVLGAAVLIVIVVAGVRYSSLGAIVLGVVLAGFGGLLVWAPLLVLRPLGSNFPLLTGLSYAGGAGGYLSLGVLVLVAGIAGVIRAGRKRAAEPAPDVDERIGYRAEQPADDAFFFPPASDSTVTPATGIVQPPADRV